MTPTMVLHFNNYSSAIDAFNTNSGSAAKTNKNSSTANASSNSSMMPTALTVQFQQQQ